MTLTARAVFVAALCLVTISACRPSERTLLQQARTAWEYDRPDEAARLLVQVEDPWMMDYVQTHKDELVWYHAYKGLVLARAHDPAARAHLETALRLYADVPPRVLSPEVVRELHKALDQKP